MTSLTRQCLWTTLETNFGIMQVTDWNLIKTATSHSRSRPLMTLTPLVPIIRITLHRAKEF